MLLLSLNKKMVGDVHGYGPEDQHECMLEAGEYWGVLMLVG